MRAEQKKELAYIGRQLSEVFPCFRGKIQFNMQGRDFTMANLEQCLALEYSGEVIVDLGNRKFQP